MIGRQFKAKSGKATSYRMLQEEAAIVEAKFNELNGILDQKNVVCEDIIHDLYAEYSEEMERQRQQWDCSKEKGILELCFNFERKLRQEF